MIDNPLVFLLICAIVSAVIGAQKGEGIISFIVGIVLGPIGVIAAIFSKGNRIKCPTCKQSINKYKACPHCYGSLNQSAQANNAVDSEPKLSSSDLPAFAQTKMISVNDELKPNGVGGWLLFLCIWLTIITPLVSLVSLSAAATSDAQWAWGIALVLFTLVTGILLWTGRRIGWRVAIAYFWIISALGWLLVIADNSPQQFSQAIGTTTVSAIWLLYLNTSKRVLNTYFRSILAMKSSSSLSKTVVPELVDFDMYLRKLAKLHDDGIISDEEFTSKKRALLNI